MIVLKRAVIVFVFIEFLAGAFEYLPRDPLNVGKGLAGLNYDGGIAGTYLDPASLATLTGRGLAFQSGEAFGLKSLKHQCGVAVFKTGWLPIGVGVSSLGNKVYSEMSLGIFTGREFSRRFRWGIEANLYSLSIKNYGSDTALGIALAWHFNLSSAVEWGTILNNVNSPEIGVGSEPLPQTIISGLLFRIDPDLNVQVEWEQDTAYKGEIKYGIFYRFRPWLSLSAGFCDRTGQWTTAVKFRLPYFNVSYALSTHPNLGNSQWVGIAVPLVKP